MRNPALDTIGRRLGAADRRVRLHPMTAAEMVDAAAALYRAQGRRILRLTAAPVLFCYLAIIFVVHFVAPAFFSTSAPDDLAVQFAEAGAALVVGLVVAFPLFLLGLGYTSALVTRLTADFLTGNLPDAREAAGAGARNAFLLVRTGLSGLAVPLGILAASLVLLAVGAVLETTGGGEGWAVASGAASLIGLILAGVSGVAAVFRQSLAPAAAVVEEQPPRAANRRSLELLKAAKPHPHGYDHLTNLMVVTLFLAAVAGFGLAAGLGLLDLPTRLGRISFGPIPVEAVLATTLDLLGWYAALWTAIPFWCCGTAILYFDRRVRLEAYDLKLLDQDARRSRRESRFVL